MNKKPFVLLLIIIAVVLAIWFFPQTIPSTNPDSETTPTTTGTPPATDPGAKSIGVAEQERMATLVYTYSGQLVDVTEGKVVRDIVTANSSGFVNALYQNGEYALNAQFGNLPEPKNGDFYEGWLVRKSDSHVISTGKVEKINNVYTNLYMSSTDLTDHTFYVLTLEPNDGNPAPADHILEGELIAR